MNAVDGRQFIIDITFLQSFPLFLLSTLLLTENLNVNLKCKKKFTVDIIQN